MYFLYFAPNAGKFDQALLDDRGLGYLTADKMTQRGYPTGQGPGDCSGVIFADSRIEGKDLYYRPEEQVWAKSLAGTKDEKTGEFINKFWVGYYTANPPTEKALARQSQIDGHRVELMAGQQFLIPCARCFPVGTKLPQSIQLTADGNLKTEMLPAYISFSKKAEDLWQIFAKQIGLIDSVEHDIGAVDQFKLAAEALGFNYRLGVDEINLLGLLTTETFSKVVLAIIDEPTFTEAIKKIGNQLKKNNTDGTPAAAEHS